MRRFNNFFIPLAAALFFSACSSVYKCGEATSDTKVHGSKRLKAVVHERDSLCNGLAMKNSENASLRSDLASLNSRNSDLQARYNRLANENLSQADQLGEKSDEIRNKEKALREMQRIISRQDSIVRKLHNTLRDALLGFKADELTMEVKNGKVYVSMSDKLLFKSGSAVVEQKGVEALKLLASVLDKNRDIDVLVEGHTDNVPIKTAVYKDNWDLSVARAASVVRILTDDFKINPGRLTASGKGEFFPKSSNETPEGKAMNRRTEIILSPKLDELMSLLSVR
jgi:chemotaxis protein MotB